jgi:hypothetical protein
MKLGTVKIELPLHCRYRAEAARRRMSLQCLISKVLNGQIEAVENEELAQRKIPGDYDWTGPNSHNLSEKAGNLCPHGHEDWDACPVCCH